VKLRFKHSAIAVIAGALAVALRPAEPLPPSAWAARHFVLPDGEHKGELIDLAKTPHLVEVIDALGPDSPDNELAVMKSAQSAFTTGLQIVVAHSIDCDPCDMMVVQPTDSALTDFNSQKLGRAIELSREAGARMRAKSWGLKVRPQTAKSGTASTTYEKKFAGGSLFLSLATSTADLRSKTIKKALLDEIDEYPRDLNEQGDPLDMVEARQISFLRAATWKRAYFSTPTIKGGSKIEEKYLAGDQRRWTMRCPHCGDENLRFDWGKNFIFERRHPFRAHYVAPCCGGLIEGAQKYQTYLSGRWVPTAEGKYKSYYFSALESPFVPFDEIARKFVEAGEDQAKLKTFYNLTLGLPFELRGDAPDWARLMERREDYPRGVVPSLGYLLVAGADVQHSGIWYEIVAYAPDGQSWTVDHGFLAGETTEPESGAFAELVKIYDRQFADAFGGRRQIDAMAVDAGDGGRANQVYAWTRLRHRAFAVKGVAGWTAPAIGTPTRVSITLKGRRVKGGAMLWPVGTWSLKATYYANLRKEGRRAGAETDPAGYCHHHRECDEQYFRQQTAEYLKTVTVRGRSSRIWQESGPNHLLDCRIYAMAMAEYLGLTRMTPEQWAKLAKLRGVPNELAHPDLLAPEATRIAAAGQAAPAAKPPLLRPAKRRLGRIISRGIE
jgi:phage terminase large subunit GpA-like protein